MAILCQRGLPEDDNSGRFCMTKTVAFKIKSHPLLSNTATNGSLRRLRQFSCLDRERIWVLPSFAYAIRMMGVNIYPSAVLW